MEIVRVVSGVCMLGTMMWKLSDWNIAVIKVPSLNIASAVLHNFDGQLTFTRYQLFFINAEGPCVRFGLINANPSRGLFPDWRLLLR